MSTFDIPHLEFTDCRVPQEKFRVQDSRNRIDFATAPFAAAAKGHRPRPEQKQRDFVGRAACESDQKNPRHQTVAIDVEGQWIPQQGAEIFDGESVVGHITSACLSPKKGHAHGLARVVNSLQNPDVEIGQLDNHMKRLRAHLHLK